jgi:hypothetical protein
MSQGGAVVCMMCARTVGQVRRGRLYTGQPGQAIRRVGRQLRCGYCRGNVYLEAEATAGPAGSDVGSAREAGLGRSRTA